MGYGYQERDFEIIDYELFLFDGIPHPLRGPAPSNITKYNYITCIGAAQTFGCYVKEPFPYLMQKEIMLPVLNFGIAGAGPFQFLKNKQFVNIANEGNIAIIQVLSGRSESNTIFKSNGGEMLTRICDNKRIGAAPAYDELIRNSDVDFINKVVDETRENWVQNTIKLLKEITVPKILFWFSVREPEYKMGFKSSSELFGDFPQLVNNIMIEKITPYADSYIEMISSEGLPQKLISRFSGKEVSISMRDDLGGNFKFVNDYYPSPEMHIKASELLIPTCKKLIKLI